MKKHLRRNLALSYCIAAGGILFAILQIYANYHQMITIDEFWFVHSIYHKFRSQLPYRDFAPYKSVLGYYLLLIPIEFNSHPFYTFVHIKNFITTINTLFLILSSLWLARLYSYQAALCSLILLLTTSFFVSTSSDIRVDMFGYWLCLASVLLLLESKPVLSGLMLGIAICISQKSLWFLAATNVSLISIWVMFERSRQDARKVFSFNSSAFSVVLAYILFWSLIAGMQPVFQNFIIDAITIYKIDIYNASEKYISRAMLLRDDPLYLTLWVIAAAAILLAPLTANKKRSIFVGIYATAFMLFIINYKQPFGYAVVAVIPPLLLLYTNFFEVLFNQFSMNSVARTDLTVTPRAFFLIMILCSLILILFAIEFPLLPYQYGLVTTLPIAIGIYIISQNQVRKKLRKAIALLFGITITSCALQTAFVTLTFSYGQGHLYQKQLLNLLKSLTSDGSQYIAGIDLLFNKNQPISGNSLLKQNMLYLRQGKSDLQQLLIPSLELNPDTSIETIIAKMEKEPIKVAINTKLFAKLAPLESYLKSHFDHLWGSVYIYSPQFGPGKHFAKMKFSGKYKLKSKQAVQINGNTIKPGNYTTLQAKYYNLVSKGSFRLTLTPESLPRLDKRFKSDIPPRLTHECSYIYVNNKKRCIFFS